MTQAVSEHLHGLLPHVQMYCQRRSPLATTAETAPMEALWSATGVRQGDQLGPLLFQLTYQPTLSDAQQSAADALVTACHDKATKATNRLSTSGLHASRAAMRASTRRPWCSARTPTRHPPSLQLLILERRSLRKASWRAGRHWGTPISLKSMSDAAAFKTVSKLNKLSGCWWTLKQNGACCTIAYNTGRCISCVTLSRSGCSLHNRVENALVHGM